METIQKNQKNTLFADIVEEISKNSSKFIGLKTGFKEYDDVWHGWHAGELIVVGACKAMGKTAFVLSSIRGMAKSSTPSALLYAENIMTAEQIARIYHVLTLDPLKYPIENNLCALKTEAVKDIPFHYVAEYGLSLLAIREIAERLVNERGAKCLFIETLQSIEEYIAATDKEKALTQICRELKKMAINLQIPIVATLQLEGKTECRKASLKHWPCEHHFTPKFAIEEMADTVIFVYRPLYYHRKANRDILYLVITKSWCGTIGTTELGFNVSSGIVYNTPGGGNSEQGNLDSMLEKSTSLQKLVSVFDLEECT